jgi:8-oxo-dGTP pyrophosphatase MutT (NUDIX family)
MASPSAVAIIETPYSYIVEGRPDLPGELAYAAKLQLLGGHSNEAPSKTICRELYEELDLELTAAAELNLKIPGEIVEIPRNEIALQDYSDQLTPFAFSALQNALSGYYDSIPG